VPDWLADYAALSAADEEHPLPGEQLERLAVAAFVIGRDDETVAVRGRAYQDYLDRGMPDAALRCGFWIGFQLQNAGEWAQAAGWLSRLRRLLPECDSTDVIGVMLEVPSAVQQMVSGNSAAALPTFEAASATMHRAGEIDWFVLAELGRARCLQISGRFDESTDSMDEIMLHVTAGRTAPQVAGLAYCSVVGMCVERFDLLRAQEWTRALSSWVDDQHGMVPYRGTCMVHRAWILQLRGSWDQAEAEADSACDQLTVSGELAIGSAHYRVAELARLRGELELADRGFQLAAANGMEVQPGLARLRLAQGRHDAAAAGLDRALTEDGPAANRPQLLAARVDVALAVDELATAQRACVELAALGGAAAPPYLRALAEQAEGAVRLADRGARAALPHLRQARLFWQEIDAPYEVACIRLLVARACRELGDLDAAEMEEQAARFVLDRLGARQGVPKANPAAAGLLSPRELEVLRLLATGATNRAIAAALVLSEKTVARHVSNIYGKLDVTSRSAATSYAYQHGLA
jgi:DNA-binding CsgD family transcriptional regulator